jgi:putative toxin-antitoxin system antitoxin component (TIGR02293 family)
MSDNGNILQEPAVAYGHTDDRGIFSIIRMVRRGISFRSFTEFVKATPFSMAEWAGFLHISERTLHRYQKENQSFDAPRSEKILQIAMLYKHGMEVFGSKEAFDTWLDTEIISLGKIKPKSLLDSSFGISILKDELSRIEHGIPS